MNKAIMLLILFLPVSVLADTSDYIWNEQFTQKLLKAEAGNARAQYDVGNMYLKGQGTVTDRRKAHEWISKAAKSGYQKAEFKLGLMFLQGMGTATNFEKAEKWLRKSANKGYGPAQYYLAGMYRDGQHVSKNYDKALSWLKKARDGGFWKAKKEIEYVTALAGQSGNRQAKVATAKPRAQTPKQSTRKAEPVRQAKRTAPVPRRQQVADKDDLRSLLMNGKWLERGRPAKYLPSEAMKCKNKGRGIYCVSTKNLKGKRGNTVFDYQIIVNINNITESGEFSASYQNNVLSVIPGKPIVIPGDEGEPDTTRPSPVIKTGLQRTIHTLECDLDTVKQISCVKDRTVNIKISRK